MSPREAAEAAIPSALRETCRSIDGAVREMSEARDECLVLALRKHARLDNTPCTAVAGSHTPQAPGASAGSAAPPPRTNNQWGAGGRPWGSLMNCVGRLCTMLGRFIPNPSELQVERDSSRFTPHLRLSPTYSVVADPWTTILSVLSSDRGNEPADAQSGAHPSCPPAPPLSLSPCHLPRALSSRQRGTRASSRHRPDPGCCPLTLPAAHKATSSDEAFTPARHPFTPARQIQRHRR